jgi:uncharacterized DUF497 family protein
MADIYARLAACEGFDWDDGNDTKNWTRHQVAQGEIEQVFFQAPLLVAHDGKHSQTEERFYGLGRTAADRGLFVVFTLRAKRIRVISARDMNRRERGIYERAQEADDE